LTTRSKTPVTAVALLSLFVSRAGAEVPVPLPGAMPVDVAKLRPGNPAVLPMVGTWRFEPIRGAFVAGGRFVAPTASASSSQTPADRAIDGDRSTRWAASGPDLPQWWQVDLGSPQAVTAVELAWEHPDGHYRFTVSTSGDGQHWKTASDHTSGNGEGDGRATLADVPARYVRLTVTGAADANGSPQWASIREVTIHVLRDGKDAVWTAPKPTTEPTVPPFTTAAFDDRDWHDIPVPGNWEMSGYSDPTYDHPDDAAGLYRRVIDVPAAFANQRVLWHFDAVMDGAEVFVNGRRVGYHEGGFTGWDLDVTDAVRPGQRNLFALRVCKTTPTVSLDSGDFWNLGGISRDTYLKAVPATHVDDVTVVTKLDGHYVDATLETAVKVRGTPGQAVSVTPRLFRMDGAQPPDAMAVATGTVGADGTIDLHLSAPVKGPTLWSAEHPGLYYLVLSLAVDGKPVEAVQHRFGFRQIDIKDGVLLWNGVPIKCTGTCRHEEWSALGHALDEHAWQTDVAMMKAANINAVRTSHYNHAVRFLELCDEKGLYVLDEIPACWSNPRDPKLKDAFVQHAVETLARDKNRPCVLAWSCGNESGFGPNFKAMADYALDTDPTRPAFVSEQKRATYSRLSFDDYHYPGDDTLQKMAEGPGPAVITEGPHIYYVKPGWEYDYGTNDLWGQVLAAEWDRVWPSKSIFGAFIWEWQDQGLADPYVDAAKKDARGVTQDNYKGIVDGFRNPKPELYHVKQVYSPVTTDARTVQPDHGSYTVRLQNRYAFTDLAELTCHWHAMAGDKELASGETHVWCPPGTTATASFPATAGMDATVLEFVHADGRSIYTTRLTTVGSPTPPPPPPAFAAPAGSAAQVTERDGAYHVTLASTTVTVDKATGRASFALPNGHGQSMAGPTLNLGERRYDNGEFLDKKGPPWIGSKSAPRLLHPDVTVTEVGGDAFVSVAGDVSLAEQPTDVLGRLSYTLDVHPDGTTDVAYAVNWTGADANAWELGLTFDLPAAYDRLGWYRDAQWTAYPPGHIGAVSGQVDDKDVSFRSTKRDAEWGTLTDAAGDGVAVLRSTTPLHVRGNATPDGVTLFASSMVASPRDFSSGYLDRYRIRWQRGRDKSGAFTLRFVGPVPAR
jgi:beta-galactosidase